MREQREREAKRQHRFEAPSAAKQRRSGEQSSEQSPMLQFPPHKDQPIIIPTSSARLLSTTLNEP